MGDSDQSRGFWQWRGLLLVSMAAVLAILVSVVWVGVNWTRKGQANVAGNASSPGQLTAVNSNPDIDPGNPAGDVPAPGFVLRDQLDRQTSLKQFRGKVVLLAFVDSHCTTICPLTTESMVDALRLLGPAASRVQLLGINANPQATLVADVAAYTNAHHMQGHWRFLTGSLPQLKRVWRDYHVYVAATHNDIDHEPIIFLIGPQGRERKIFLTQMSFEGVSQQAQLLAEGIARLLPEHPAVERRISLRYIRPIKPVETLQLAAVGRSRQQVDLGKEHPHLLLFFAGWLREDSNLPVKLAILNRYAAAARRHGWPSPVAVNELSTEASAKGAEQMLARLAAKLQVPIVQDVSGRLADGYGVEGLPWFVLSSRSGRILWHHSGWLNPAELNRQVSAALATN